MSESLAAYSRTLFEHTLALCDTLERGGEASPEMDGLIARQLEAFNDFSRRCDPARSLDAETRRNVDAVLSLEARIVSSIERIRAALVEQSRRVEGRRYHARAFQSQASQEPRFFTRRV